MTRPAFLSRLFHRSLHGWLMGLMLLCIGEAASAQQDPPGRVARLNLQQGVVSFSPAGDDKWYDAQPNRPITTGDRLWTAANARAEVFVGSSALRLDGKTMVEFTTLDDDTLRITTMEGSLQLRVRDDLAGQRVEVDTGNLAVVIDAPGEYRVVADATGGTSWIAVAAGRATLYGENGESQTLSARQALTVAGRSLGTAGPNAQVASPAFDTWVADRNRVEDESVSARYVSREIVGYQQLDGNGDWQNDGDYGPVWYPRNVDNDWAPYRDGQWVDVAPWGWTWVDAAPWGFAPFHYGRWARFGSRWGWVPGRSNARPVYSPALVAFVGGGGTPNVRIASDNHPRDIGWFPLAPGEQWRPGYNASRRYIDQANRMAFFRNRQAEWRDSGHANQLLPGAMTVLPADRFGRGPFGRRDLVRLPDDRFARVPVATTPSIAVPHGGFGSGSNFGRPAAMQPPAALIGQPQQQLQQARQQQQMQWQQQQLEQQQRAGQVHQFQAPPLQQQQLQFQQQQALRQQQEMQQRALQQQQVQVQQQTMWRQQQEAQQRAAQQNMVQQQQMQMQLQQQQALRQQQEMQQRAAQTHQFQVQQQQQQNAMRAVQQQQQQPSRVIAIPQPQQPQQPQGHRFDPQRMNQGRQQ